MTEWTPAKNAFLVQPDFTQEAFAERWPGEHSFEAVARQRRRLRNPDLKPRVDDPDILWDKKEADFHWTDVLEPVERMQEIAKAASNSQDFAQIAVDTDEPFPLMLISDWHIGSWGISYKQLAETTKLIQALGIRIGIMGDMLQMSIRLRSVLEIGDNLLSPRMQMLFLESWLEDMAPLILWSTWDNHSVVREEELTGFSHYAELFKRSTIYHSGIGHIDLTVGDETYKLAVSHKFTGNSAQNPTGGQERYMRFEGIDREIAIAGDSHRPSLRSYTDGPLERLAVNCGSLQKDSGFSKRFFSLYTHDWMPVVELWPDEHLMVPYPSLKHYLKAKGSELSSQRTCDTLSSLGTAA